MITDGKQTTTQSFTRLSVASRGIKNKGVILYALGVGSGADRAELEEIASGPQYVLTSSSFEDIQYLAPQITKGLCELATGLLTITFQRNYHCVAVLLNNVLPYVISETNKELKRATCASSFGIFRIAKYRIWKRKELTTTITCNIFSFAESLHIQ